MSDSTTLRTSENEAAVRETADEVGIKAARLRHPSGWLLLAGTNAVRTLTPVVDSAAEWRVEDVVEHTDLAHDAATEALAELASLDVLVADDDVFRVNDQSLVLHALSGLDDAVAATGGSDGFAALAKHEPTRLMVDALLYADPSWEFTQADLHAESGVSRKAVWMHIDRLVEFGILTETNDEYVIESDSATFQWLRALNAAVVGTRTTP